MFEQTYTSDVSTPEVVYTAIGGGAVYCLTGQATCATTSAPILEFSAQGPFGTYTFTAQAKASNENAGAGRFSALLAMSDGDTLSLASLAVPSASSVTLKFQVARIKAEDV